MGPGTEGDLIEDCTMAVDFDPVSDLSVLPFVSNIYAKYNINTIALGAKYHELSESAGQPRAGT